MTDRVTPRFSLTRREYAAGTRAASDRVIRVGAVAGAGLLAVGVAAGLELVAAAGGLIVVGAVVAWAVPWWRWLGEPLLAEEERWVIDDHGCSIERAGSQSSNSWAFYREVVDAGPVYALLTVRAGVDIVPKRAFESEGDLEAFLALADAHVAVRRAAAPASGWTD